MKLSMLEWSGLGLVVVWIAANLYFYHSYPESHKLSGDLIAILGLMFFGVGYRNRVMKNRSESE
jgi:hypothetical protein